MKRSRFSEEQMIGIRKEHEAGVSVGELCRKHAMSSATFYSWKAKFGGLEVSDARKLTSQEAENARLKKLLADAMLDSPRTRYSAGPTSAVWRGGISGPASRFRTPSRKV